MDSLTNSINIIASNYVILPKGNYSGNNLPDLYIAKSKLKYSDERVRNVMNLPPNNKRTINSRRCVGNITHPRALKMIESLGGFTPSVLIFKEFIRMLKSGIEERVEVIDGLRNPIPVSSLNKIYSDILSPETNSHKEWLFDRYLIKRGELQMIAYSLSDSVFQESERVAQPYLSSSMIPGIDFNYWLNNSTSEGLPALESPKGSFLYWVPGIGRAARFCKCSNNVGLDCSADLNLSLPDLGVREVRLKI